jgi:hypothetical protein
MAGEPSTIPLSSRAVNAGKLVNSAIYQAFMVNFTKTMMRKYLVAIATVL